MKILRDKMGELYHKIAGNKYGFIFTIWLRETGVVGCINYLLDQNKKMAAARKPSVKEMQETRKFMRENKVRIERMLNMLADEESRKVWKAVMAFRAKGTPIPRKMRLTRNQYFVDDIIKLQNGEVLVDGGVATGEDIVRFFHFAKKNKIRISKVIGFEPDISNRKLLNIYFGGNKRVKIIEKGLSDQTGIVFFQQEGETSRILVANNANRKNVVKIPVVDLDSLPQCREASFIKMDIEGSEMQALRGAEEIIKRNHPKLAICIYHSLEDMVRIVEYIHNLVPEYRIFVRHHGYCKAETVMYAVPENR